MTDTQPSDELPADLPDPARFTLVTFYKQGRIFMRWQLDDGSWEWRELRPPAMLDEAPRWPEAKQGGK